MLKESIFARRSPAPVFGAMTRIRSLYAVTLLLALAASPLAAAELGSSVDPRPATTWQFVPVTRNVTASPEFVLESFLRRSQQQREQLTEYSDTTVIHADLPDTSQSGEYELRRRFVAPKTLEFKPVRFTGDSFVKTNIIIRLLQSEVDHVTKEQAADTAIDQINYKFKLKYTQTSYDGREVTYVYDVKPRKKRPGLIKGRIWVDAHSGALRRVEGTLAKSPSFFIKRLEFVQEYQEVDGFSLPSHLHSVSNVRILGRTIVDIFHRDYQSSVGLQNGEVASGGAR
jgi:hypothetical protein